MTRILALAGSLRKDSFNKKLIRIAARAAEEAGGAVTLIDLRDYPLPIFDQDLEAEKGMPEHAATLKKLMIEQDGFLIASPEYNSSITGFLKNTIDWVSRPAPNEPSLVAYQGKLAALMAASPGQLGGLRGLVHLRAILGNIGVLVLAEQVAVPQAMQAFHDDGSLKDAKQQSNVQNLGRKLVELAGKVRR
jgi:chromate reductase